MCRPNKEVLAGVFQAFMRRRQDLPWRIFPPEVTASMQYGPRALAHSRALRSAPNAWRPPGN
ncbi:hypothetical protein D5047_03955 [Verminephrobacter eiseniae]|nr:hypothetical protein [Verminephrobacter eiseniae]